MSAGSHLPRFFCPRLTAAGPVLLTDDDHHHLVNVLRMGSGATVSLFDGQGREARATVQKVGKREVLLEAGAPVPISRETPFPVCLAVSLPKGDRQKILVGKLTEIGVTTLIPLVAQRSVARPDLAALQRLQRQVISASQQCGRNVLMAIADPAIPAELVAQRAPDVAAAFAHPGPASGPALSIARPGPALVAIGPEGGFTDGEVALFQEGGWAGFQFGPSILRVETAALAAATIWIAAGIAHAPPSGTAD